jgi:hypothetical protein
MLKVLENTMRSEAQKRQKAKGKSLGNLQAKRPHYKVESRKSNVECLGKHHTKRHYATNNKICASVAKTPSEGQKRLKAKVQHQWLKTQAKRPTPKTKQKKTAPFGAVLMQ